MAKVSKINQIAFFHVGNGDTILLSLKDDTNILIDCNITKDSCDPDVEEKYDIVGYLLEKLPRDSNDRPHLDVFILSHPDIDHCRSIAKYFYMGDPDKYGEKDKDKIIIDELWFAPRVFNEHKNDLNNDAKDFRKETERRIKLYKKEEGDEDVHDTGVGNRVRIIGSTDNEKLEDLKNVTTPAGQYVSIFNSKEQEEFKFFVLGPVKAESDDTEAERNECSIILKAEFNINSKETNNVVILAGDSRIENWRRIMNLNSEEDLRFDIFLAPHHCSWYFFSMEDYKKKPAPNAEKDMVSFIDYGKDSEDIRVIIASCKEIKRNEDNPPHYRAANLYKEAVGEENFYCLATYPDADAPKPLIFTFTENGPVKQDIEETKKESAAVPLIKTASTPKTYG
ncbi:hypothetical protein [Clostridium magnum]|uniref:Metallohydrolase n=1 Tax=Clostridium magnum DSM 2767 TaxID=1121326 RepID=A0A162TZ56_9CLOT|nr:hypothetical protein [Clostridium magnum]KZL93243.1 hypothetical protein CLMAG_02660 [Clostridium magnum DSM 2767]SHI19295.1 hypothetical protein SAMN02745944_03079 [Clostridium magnum DSM 2767]